MTEVPFVPPANPLENYLAHKEEIDLAVRRVLERGTYILGPEVASFEREFAEYLGVEFCVGVANGTDALVLALRGLRHRTRRRCLHCISYGCCNGRCC